VIKALKIPSTSTPSSLRRARILPPWPPASLGRKSDNVAQIMFLNILPKSAEGRLMKKPEGTASVT
jgi:hypothetical protein